MLGMLDGRKNSAAIIDNFIPKLNLGIWNVLKRPLVLGLASIKHFSCWDGVH